MIKIILLIGFLGAGKTTLLTSLLDSYKKRKIGVIVNEFGEINIDAKLLKREGIEMAELSNGSIFCACIKDKFVESLIELSHTDFEYLFIEASGLADPANMGEILSGISHKTKNKYFLEGAVCVVDACSFIELSDVLPALENQVAYANAVLINKVDLVSEERLQEVEEAILSVNPKASIYKTTYCKTDMEKVVSEFSVLEKESSASTNTWESRPVVYVPSTTEIISYEALQGFLTAVAPESYRIKGFALTDRGMVQISCVGVNINITPWEDPIPKTEIVVISAVGVKIMSTIIAASKAHTEGKLKV
jgi:G3E family GTPase